jgi:hypothetical protein
MKLEFTDQFIMYELGRLQVVAAIAPPSIQAVVIMSGGERCVGILKPKEIAGDHQTVKLHTSNGEQRNIPWHAVQSFSHDFRGNTSFQASAQEEEQAALN